MKFQPKTEQEVGRLFEKGEYPFIVSKAVERQSKNGKPMIELDLWLEHTSIAGKIGFAKCYLLTDEPNFEFLIRHFCYSVGCGDLYESGNIEPHQLEGKRGFAKIGIEIDKTGTYPDKNKVIDFIENNLCSNNCPDLNDDIPFA